jgi:hypothetical protein
VTVGLPARTKFKDVLQQKAAACLAAQNDNNKRGKKQENQLRIIHKGCMYSGDMMSVIMRKTAVDE